MVLGGDDVSALVLDIGSATTRAGFAGDDLPKAVFPSSVGVDPTHENVGKRKNYIGDGEVYLWRENMEIKSPMQNGIVHDWDALETVWEYALKERLHVEPSQHPLLVSEAVWSTRDVREKMIELAFEKFDVPAFYIAKSAVLSAFSAGRPTALVIDSGADSTSITPVVDGFALKKGLQKSPIAGDAISNFAKALLESYKVNLVPQYLVNKKLPVDAGHKPPPELLFNRRATKSYHGFATKRVLNEFKETVLQISEYNFHPNMLSSRAPKTFEFPDGYNNAFGIDRFRIPEIMFNPSMNPQYSEAAIPGVHQLVMASLNACDPEVRGTLFSNLVVVGGTSVLPGFVERLNTTLGHGHGFKHRIHAVNSSFERKYSSWIGGSILGSLGNFHQMWISKAEYAEKGVSVEKRLP